MAEARTVELTIDGKTVRAREGALLLQAARDAGFEIPSLCWHRKLTPTGACRLCVVKVAGARGFVTACSTTVREGMAVTAFDEELEAARRFILECLAAEVRFGSDGSHRDEFEELAERYALAKPEGRTMDPLGLDFPPVDESSPVLSFDPSRCVKCFRCVKACAEVQGKGVLSFVGRGIRSRISAGSGAWGASECDACGECAQLCPTGAIVEKPNRATFRAIGNPRAVRHVQTTCPYCGVGCQLDLSVHGGRILRADGVEGVSPNDGRLCVKGRFGLDFVAHPERLTVPLVKENGVFREAGWDEALALAAEGFLRIKRDHGPGALAGYSSAKCTNEENYLFHKLVRVAFGTNNVDYCTRLCHASTVTAMLKAYGDGAGSNSIEDFGTTDCLFVVGNNTVETHPVTATYMKAGKARGASLIVMDPKWTPLAAYADVWLRPRLGTDVAVLNGMARIVIREGLVDRRFVEARVSGGLSALAELEAAVEPYDGRKVFEISGVPEEALRKATLLYAGAPTAIIATGMGMSQQTVGTHNVFALINLALITGQIGKPGAGIDPPRGQNNVQGATDSGASPIYLPGYQPLADEANRRRMAELWGLPFGELPAEKGLTTVEIMKAAGEGVVKGMLIMGENPMHTDPDLGHVEAAIDRLEFLVVQDIFLTATARKADIVLPSACFAEKDGTFVNSDRRVLRVRKAVEPPGEAREDLRILLELAGRMGRPIGAYPDASAVWDELSAAAPIFGGIDYARLEGGGVQWPCPTRDHPGTPTLFLERFNTPDGLARLNPVEYAAQSERPDAEYPFVLSSGRMLYQYHSSTMSGRSVPLVALAKESYLLMNPRDAGREGFKTGTRVTVRSRRGALETTVRVSEEVAEGELFMPFHFGDALVNRLTRDELDPYSRIPPFKYTACEVRRTGADA